MLKEIIVLLAFNSFVVFGQKSVVFYDNEFKIPVRNVQVFDMHEQFIGLSNSEGKLSINNSALPFVLKCGGFKIDTISLASDTVFLTPKFQVITEMTAKPVVKLMLYEAIIEKSNGLLNRKNESLFGRYFEAMMIVDTKNKDTVRADLLADMAIKKAFKKKHYTYEIFLKNGTKGYKFTDNDGKLAKNASDTASFMKMLNVLPSFEKNFDYDLINTKPFKLKYEENKIQRILGADFDKLIFEEQDKLNEKIIVEYSDSVLMKWRKTIHQNKVYDGSGIFMNFNTMDKDLSYGSIDEYGLKGIIENNIIEIGLNGILYEIYLVKGFLPDETKEFELVDSAKSIKAYFESIQNLDSGNHFYNFEQKNKN